MAQLDANTTLYVGNLDHSVTEELIVMLFGQLGPVVNCKMFREPNNDPYCFVEFNDHNTAVHAISMMNDKLLIDRKMRVDWATGQGNKTKYAKVDTTKHFHIYVGDLSPEIEEQALREAFTVFGEISDTKIVKDPQSFKSRGYGFVVFPKKVDAETAISAMNGQWLGRKMIKVRWATRKPQTQTPGNEPKKLTFDDVFSQSAHTNTTVFCGGLKQDVTEEIIQKYFSPFGQIEKIKIFREKGYCFIKYASKDCACQAIVDMHNTSLSGQIIRCSWGKDTGESTPISSSTTTTPQSTVSTTSQAQVNGAQQSNDQVGYWPRNYYQQMGSYNQMGYNQYYGYQPNASGYMWMGWGQQGWNNQQQPTSQVPPSTPQQPPQPPLPPPPQQ